jgi:hypothetical protein
MQGEYTKDEMIDQILDGVENPQNLSNAVRGPFVAKYLAAAINFANTKQYWAEIDQDLDGLSEIDDIFVGEYRADVKWDAETETHYFVMPATPMNLPKGKGIKFIGPEANQAISYKPVRQNMLSAMMRSMAISKYGFYLPGRDKYTLYNHPTSVKKLLIKMIVSVSSMKGDDILPIPAGMEIDVLNMARDWFLGKRQLPLTTVNDNKDEPK